MVEPLVLQVDAGDESLVGALFVFLVNLLVGTVGIRLGARLVVDSDTGYRRAAVTALLGAVVWAVVAFVFDWIPVLGPLLSLLAWVGLINWRYEGGWLTAAGIGLVAWLVVVGILYVLAALGVIGFSALGVPGA
ncbi:hypothetical protein [Halomarina oriensis]|uniref:Uncharacterized protein n=1 Tax=Halomarina oriensis TaxID=671145 RepID=A0A6B0GRL2_9EURY|nr:hypothetical protein [Halomarina oriensis]MWG34308.1 hypothetical protein [Halomarina oriensis]